MKFTWCPLLSLVTISLGCGSTTDEFVIEARPSPTPSSIGGDSLPIPEAPKDLCADIACCEARLGASSNACLTVALVQGHCAVTHAAEGTECGAATGCAGASTCSAGQCMPALGAGSVDCSGLDGPCVLGTCDVETGACAAVPAPGQPCSDGDACTDGDLCDAAGGCSGLNKSCDDGDPCTADTCDAGTGSCVSGPNTCSDCKTASDCPPLSPCTGVYECVEGSCAVLPDSAACALLVASPCHTLTCDEAVGACVEVLAGAGDSCDDGSECTENDVCSEAGACTGSERECVDGTVCTTDGCSPEAGCTFEPVTGTECDDDSLCTTEDHCDAGTCAGTALPCDDQNPCTDDGCAPGTGCTTAPSTGATCDDGDLCTGDDVCGADGCGGSPVFCGCDSDLDCVDDGDLCNGTPVCHEDTCQIDPATVVSCAGDSILSDCQAPACTPATGQCEPADLPDGTSCSDADPCTQGDECGGGTCSGESLDCNDGVACTLDVCDPSSGCKSTNSTDACNDGDACTESEVCGDGTCGGGVAVDCNDGQICTADSCIKKSGCKYSPLNGACNDGSACTSGDGCLNGACKGTAKVCPGGSACTVAACAPATGACSVVAKDCDDHDACTTDQCDPDGECLHTAVLCAGDPCQVASCEPATGCVYVAKNCADNDVCTEDGCLAGLCTNTALSCSDNDGCTVDSCGQLGCEYAAVVCTDGDPCTTDACSDGSCKSTPISCIDTNPCTTDACSGGLCSNVPVVCDDENPCTADSCGADGLCAFVAKICNDGIACTADACSGGDCVYSPVSADCDDANPCTTDTCDAQADCLYVATTAGCNDNDACTSGEACSAGQCKPATYICGPCVNKAEGEGCDDSDSATIGDFCYRGWCRGFEKHLVAATSPAGALALDDVSISGGGYYAVATESTTVGDTTTTRSLVAGIGLDGDLDLFPGTGSTNAWLSMGDSVAVGEKLGVATFAGGTWTSGGWIPTALVAMGKSPITSGDINAVWRDAATDTTFVAGRGLDTADNKQKAWIARCVASGQTCTEDGHAYTSFAKTEIPRALTGYSDDAPASLLIAEYPASTGSSKYFNEAFYRGGLTDGIKWKLDLFEPTAAEMRSVDVHAIGPTTMFWVGTGGLLRTRSSVDASGTATWSKLANLWFNQGNASFSGVWLDSKITLVANTAPSIGSAVELQLVTHPTAAAAATAANWRRISLGVVQPVNAPCIGTFCLPFGAQGGALRDVWSDGETIVLVGWEVPVDTSTKRALIFVRRIL